MFAAYLHGRRFPGFKGKDFNVDKTFTPPARAARAGLRVIVHDVHNVHNVHNVHRLPRLRLLA